MPANTIGHLISRLFDLAADDIAYLKHQGVSAEVITAMINHDKVLGEKLATIRMDADSTERHGLTVK